VHDRAHASKASAAPALWAAPTKTGLRTDGRAGSWQRGVGNVAAASPTRVPLIVAGFSSRFCVKPILDLKPRCPWDAPREPAAGALRSAAGRSDGARARGQPLRWSSLTCGADDSFFEDDADQWRHNIKNDAKRNSERSEYSSFSRPGYIIPSGAHVLPVWRGRS